LIAKTESTYATNPGGTGWTSLRFNSESLKPTASSTRSEEIRADRATANIIRTDVGAAGDVSGNLMYGAHDLLITKTLQSGAYSSFGGESGSIAVNASGQFELAAGWNGASMTPLPGDWFRTTGFTNAGSNGVFKAIAADATTISVAETLVPEVAGAGKKLTISAFASNG